jgi:uncharacterized repeat protein (TIGR03803 family)
MGKIKAMMPIAVLVILFQYPATAQVFTSLVNFAGSNGATPMYMTLIEANDGNLYGTTIAGGASSEGVLFQMTLNGQLKLVYSFCNRAHCSDGEQPYGGVIQGTDGNLYGTTAYGGFRFHPFGTVFETTLSGTLRFCTCSARVVLSGDIVPTDPCRLMHQLKDRMVNFT